MEPFWAGRGQTLYHGDCLEVLRSRRFAVNSSGAVEVVLRFPDASVDAVVTDPPYGLEFMGKEWDRFSGAVTDRRFKGLVLSQQRVRNVRCPDCGRWAYDHPGRLCECGGIRRAQVSVYQAWCEQWAAECLRVLKPGGHLVAFGGTRTHHRMVCAIEDAGFEIRDSLHWLYGGGMPKGLNVGKAIDRAAGAQREVIGTKAGQPGYSLAPSNNDHRTYGRGIGNTSDPEAECAVTAPATEDAARWEGWNTALKPGHEPIVLARKPLVGTVVDNVLRYGTGALNVDGCRVAGVSPSVERREAARRNGWAPARESGSWANDRRSAEAYLAEKPGEAAGRWPPNILLTHSADCQPVGPQRVRGSRIGKLADPAPGGRVTYGHGLDGPRPPRGVGDEDGMETVQAWQCAPGCPAAAIDAQSGDRPGGGSIVAPVRPRLGAYGIYGQGEERTPFPGYADGGGASRFFPQSQWTGHDTGFLIRYHPKADSAQRPGRDTDDQHPTVKPLGVGLWLVKLVVPPRGVMLDLFTGTGTFLEAAAILGADGIGIEKHAKSCRDAVERLTDPSGRDRRIRARRPKPPPPGAGTLF